MLLTQVFDSLKLTKENGLYITEESLWKNDLALPSRIERLIEKKIEPKAFFCFDNKPFILFFENPKEKEQLHEAIWNFNECPIAIIIESDEVEIFNGFKFDKGKRLLEKLGGFENLNDFSYFELVTGRTWESYKDNLTFKNRVDYQLLQNIKAARKILLNDNGNKAKLVNSILGKIIFVRYLIDRKVKIKFDGRSRLWTNTEFCSLLDDPQKIQSFFEYLEDKDKGFNGDLFPLSVEEYAQISLNDYQLIKKLLMGDDIVENQPSLFEFYDFSIIPIEFISNVYELFIGQDNQKKEGAYYTPLFLVDYILKETVEKKLTDTDYSCKVLDPACGSGIFLVETLRKVIEKYIQETGIDTKTEKFKTAIKKLAIENIFGIDKDLSAVQVAIFSIYLTLLDYLEPAAIEDAFKFPHLLNTNFFHSDFFNEKDDFNTSLKQIEFDFILGNPPWKGNGMNKIGDDYFKERLKRELIQKKRYKVAISNKEIAEGFILRISDFCSVKTKISLIIKSTILYNLGYAKDESSAFRQYLLEEYFIDKVFELAPVRHEVFEKSNQPAIAPAAILFYRYANGKNTDKNVVQHISLKKSKFFTLFKIFTINRNDFKRVDQINFKLDDWLWKILVYGSYLDFNFIKRLKTQFPLIKDTVSDKKRFIQSTGLHSRTNALKTPKNTIAIENIPLLKTEAIDSFFIDYNKTDTLENDKIDIIKNPLIYHPPMLLIREGIDMSTLTAKCAISKRSVLFKDSITSIKDLDGSNINVLYNILSILSSKLFTYYSICTFSSIGIERERVKNYNKYSLPYLDFKSSETIENISTANEEIWKEKQNDFPDNFKINKLKNDIIADVEVLNRSIYEKLELNDVELTLIDYSIEINRTLINKEALNINSIFKSLTFKSKEIIAYTSIFLNRFRLNLESKDKKFVIEIWHTKQIIGMLFKVVPISKYNSDIIWIDKQNDDATVLSFLTLISSEKITDRLFVQKDIRGFENDYFYIFKPNEKRLWHPAIAHLDVNEFADAILNQGRNTTL